MNTTSRCMPWNELIEAFIFSLPQRMRNQEIAHMSAYPVKSLREFRTLTIGGYRQSGKTTAGFKVVRENPQARLMGSYIRGFPTLAQNEDTIRSRILTIEDIDQERLAGVKLLIIDTDGYVDLADDPHGDLMLVYHHHHDWFDPEFSVILIL